MPPFSWLSWSWLEPSWFRWSQPCLLPEQWWGTRTLLLLVTIENLYFFCCETKGLQRGTDLRNSRCPLTPDSIQLFPWGSTWFDLGCFVLFWTHGWHNQRQWSGLTNIFLISVEPSKYIWSTNIFKAQIYSVFCLACVGLSTPAESDDGVVLQKVWW